MVLKKNTSKIESFKKPYFSIVIPTKDRVELAKKVVFHTLAQTNQDFEIVLVDKFIHMINFHTFYMERQAMEPK
jgi:hypothetical protein